MVKSIYQMIRDSVITPYDIDWKQIYNRVMKAYIHQPLIGRTLNALGSGTPVKVDFDGKRIWEGTLLNDVDEPEYDYTPGEKDTNIDGTLIQTNLPQIYETVRMSKDELKLLFAQQERLPIVMNQITAKVAQKEDKIIFRGDTATSVNGLISSDSYDLGNPAGPWGYDAGSNGILTHMKTDWKKAIDYFTTNGLGGRTIDVCVTSYVAGILNTTLKVYGDAWAWDYFTKMLNGGRIFISDNVQSSVTTTQNSAVFIVRDSDGWGLYSSEVEQEQEKTGLWAWRYGLREKFSVRVFNNKYVAWMDGISNATTST